MKTTILLLIILAQSLLTLVQAQNLNIDNFDVKESLLRNGKIAIVATDSLDHAQEKITGVYKFSINGFEQSLKFQDGIATPSHPIDGSTFVYFKHKNQEKSTGKLYFLYKKEDKITPIKINGLLLLIIPAFVLLIAYTLKRFISTFIVLAIIYAYFSFSKGLSLSKVLESALEILKNLF